MNRFFGYAPIGTVSLALAALLAPACSSTHGPQPADTATSWLRACLDDGDCHAGANCVLHLCTLPCGADEAACAPLAAGASCQTREDTEEAICDLACDADRDCRALGGAYSCQERHCRPASSVQATQSLVFELPDARVSAWDPRAPIASWAEDRWRVALAGRRADERTAADSPYALAVTEIPGSASSNTRSADETLEVRTSVVTVNFSEAYAIGRDGRVAMASTRALTREDVGLSFISAEGIESEVLPCLGSMVPAAAIRDSEWLFLCRSDESTVSLGRYDVDAQRWTAPPRDVLVDLLPMEEVMLSVRGRDAVMFRQRPRAEPDVALVTGAADPAVHAIPTLRWQTVDMSSVRLPGREGIYAGAVFGGWVVPSWSEDRAARNIDGEDPNIGRFITPKEHELAPTGLLLGDDGTLGAPVRFVLAASGSVYLASIAGAPESERIAFCYSTHDADDLDASGAPREDLLLSVFDRDGARVAGPIVLTDGRSGAHGTCNLTWSDSALLATWNECPALDFDACQPRGRIISLR